MLRSEPKGFAFVEFKTERDANDARAGLDGVRIDGREVRVVFAQERRKTTDQMRDREKTYAFCFMAALLLHGFFWLTNNLSLLSIYKPLALALCVPWPWWWSSWWRWRRQPLALP